MISKEVLSKIKILAFDMDDTLLNPEGVLSEKNKRSIMKAMEKGYHVVIATGRVLSAISPDVLAVEGIRYAVTSNGARVTDIHKSETIYANFLAKEEVEKIMPLISDPTMMKEVFYDNHVYADKHCLENLPQYGITNDWNKNYIITTRTPVENTMLLIKENIDSLENINLTFASGHSRASERIKPWRLLCQIFLLIFLSPRPH